MKKEDIGWFLLNNKETLVRILTIITSIVIFVPIIAFVIYIVIFNFQIDDKPTLLEQIKYNRKKSRAISSDELNTLPEMKMLLDNGVPAEAVYAFILNPSYALDDSLYPVLAREAIIIRIGYADHHIDDDNFSQKDYTAALIPLAGQEVPKYSLTPGMQGESLVTNAVVTRQNYAIARLYFPSLKTEEYHKVWNIGSIELKGSYKIPAPGVNMYTKEPFTMKRDDITLIVVSAEEMTALKHLRDMCETRDCETP